MISEKMRFPDETTVFGQISVSGNLCVITNPSGEIPEDTSMILLVSQSGQVYGRIEGYATRFRTLDGSVYLSNDGSIYQEPEPPEGPVQPTAEELLAQAKEEKRAEVSSACEQAIYSGVSVQLSDGSKEHYSLTEHDQLNLFGKQVQLAAGVEMLEYHADGQPCRYYAAADMQAIIQTAMWHVSYHTTYCNALYMWINAACTLEEVETIAYGCTVPEEHQSDVLRNLAGQGGGHEDS